MSEKSPAQLAAEEAAAKREKHKPRSLAHKRWEAPDERSRLRARHFGESTEITHEYTADTVALLDDGCPNHEAKADLIVAAVNALPTLLDELERLRKALEPFAKAADIRLCGGEDHWTDEKRIQGTDVGFHITFGDLRRARTALQGATDV